MNTDITASTTPGTIINAEVTDNNPPVVLLQSVNIYQEEHLVLENVSLQIKQGAFVYLIGRTGSGKSSILKTIYGALPLKNGEGMVAGFNLRKIKHRHLYKLRRRLGMIFQDFNLLQDRSVEDNLRFVLRATGWKDRRKMDLKIDEVLSHVALQYMKHKMPFALSGGEQQRLAIARALLNDPELIIADEPTGNLDPDTSDSILRLLYRLNQESNTTILLATHDYRLMEQIPGQVLRCEGGRVRQASS